MRGLGHMVVRRPGDSDKPFNSSITCTTVPILADRHRASIPTLPRSEQRVMINAYRTRVLEAGLSAYNTGILTNRASQDPDRAFAASTQEQTATRYPTCAERPRERISIAGINEIILGIDNALSHCACAPVCATIASYQYIMGTRRLL